MKIDKIIQKSNDLAYRIGLDKIALSKANYNLKYADVLSLSPNKIAKYEENKAYYESKLKSDESTYNAFVSYLKSVDTNSNDSDYLFRCTFPYNKVDNLSCYQTSIFVDDEIVGLFANDVSYKDVIECLDEDDIYGIDTSFKTSIPSENINDKNVAVDIVDLGANACFGKPVIANDGSIISSAKLSDCYSDYKKYSFKDLNGDTYNAEVPSFEALWSLKNKTDEVVSEYNNYKNLEETVVNKINLASDRMSTILDQFDAV